MTDKAASFADGSAAEWLGNATSGSRRASSAFAEPASCRATLLRVDENAASLAFTGNARAWDDDDATSPAFDDGKATGAAAVATSRSSNVLPASISRTSFLVSAWNVAISVRR
jgi:hypothetical protein